MNQIKSLPSWSVSFSEESNNEQVNVHLISALQCEYKYMRQCKSGADGVRLAHDRS